MRLSLALATSVKRSSREQQSADLEPVCYDVRESSVSLVVFLLVRTLTSGPEHRKSAPYSSSGSSSSSVMVTRLIASHLFRRPRGALAPSLRVGGCMVSQRRAYNGGYPFHYVVQYDDPNYDCEADFEFEEIPRDEFGVPAHIPPELSTQIRHTYYVPPQYYPFLKKLGEDTPELKPYTDKLIMGDMTYDDYEEMFYKFAKPLKIYRSRLPLPYRTDAEIAQEKYVRVYWVFEVPEVAWCGKWYSYRQRVQGDYYSRHYFRDWLIGILLGTYLGNLYVKQHRQYRVDMKLFYLEAPEHKINWVKPRGDL
ncbi:hypothetical protein FOL46_008864 [Perkinsus olseni]|uniref:Uncharacterized protein n=1 Tax=Perkinsus olseni TaxID=32597 RepID=A0A7J6L495_PEROL|nr:hypothetical protein FOL46_008864 [Perkinsus olseni]